MVILCVFKDAYAMQDDLYYPHTFVQDLLWDTLHYVTEPIMKHWPFNKLRERAVQKAIKYMRYGATESRYITIGCVEKVRNKQNKMMEQNSEYFYIRKQV